MSNKITRLALQMLAIEADAPSRFEYNTDQQIKEKPTLDDFIIHCFEQIWPDTSCGFGGISGQALTVGNTVVLEPNGVNQPILVYFNGRFAYTVPLKYYENVYKDLRKNTMAAVYEKYRYFKEVDKE